jgi:hypothetical protein
MEKHLHEFKFFTFVICLHCEHKVRNKIHVKIARTGRFYLKKFHPVTLNLLNDVTGFCAMASSSNFLNDNPHFFLLFLIDFHTYCLNDEGKKLVCYIT